ncbi:MAG: hypothetical protein K5922_08955 [Clostridiales bacterium]|nr:hypothetical protein [Clostridiales bacterium]
MKKKCAFFKAAAACVLTLMMLCSGGFLPVLAAASAEENRTEPAAQAPEKGLLPPACMDSAEKTHSEIMKARFGEEEEQAAGSLFTLDLPGNLSQDKCFRDDDLKKYYLWTNKSTQIDCYLLPNATRLYTTAGWKLQYVADVLRGDIQGEGENTYIEIVTALTAYAFSNPMMPLGNAGSLNLGNGELTIPSLSEFELYLHDVSAAWMREKIGAGFLQGYIADPSAANDTVQNGLELPKCVTIAKGLAPDGDAPGREAWWMGDTPETAKDPEQELIFLSAGEEADSMDAFRTSVNMIAEGAEPVNVSLYLFRDSKTDRVREDERYNILFFDTPAGEKSLVKVITNVLGGRELVVPRPLRIRLRSFTLPGADLPVYSLTDRYIVFCDGSDGRVSLFDGSYEVSVTGDVFDSTYLHIERSPEGDPVVTIKKDLCGTWAEWTGANTAVDQNGTKFELVDRVWREIKDETP